MSMRTPAATSFPLLLKWTYKGARVPGSAGRSPGLTSSTIDGPETPKALKNRSAPAPSSHTPDDGSNQRPPPAPQSHTPDDGSNQRASPLSKSPGVFIAHSYPFGRGSASSATIQNVRPTARGTHG